MPDSATARQPVMLTLSARNVIVPTPLGLPAVAVTVAVNVTDCPNVLGLMLEASDVVVGRGTTAVTVKVASTGPFPSVTVTMCAPAVAPEGTTNVHVKSPLLLLVHAPPPGLVVRVTLPLPANVAVIALFLLKLSAVTVTVVPTGPDVGLKAMVESVNVVVATPDTAPVAVTV